MYSKVPFLGLPQISEEKKSFLWNIYSHCSRKEVFDHDEYARFTMVYIDNLDHQNWIYETLIAPLGIEKNHIKNLYVKSQCCGINFNLWKKGDMCVVHKDMNPTKIHFPIKIDGTDLFFPDENVSWDYQTPVLLDVSRNHVVTDLERLDSLRIMLQIFLVKDFDYYAEIIKNSHSVKNIV